ncbi:MAG: hypothetical protein JWO24_2985, partial [Rhodospirillales bacterium]|nr:hypothetical protein [Rhodospirillales bacterium]
MLAPAPMTLASDAICAINGLSLPR